MFTLDLLVQVMGQRTGPGYATAPPARGCSTPDEILAPELPAS